MDLHESVKLVRASIRNQKKMVNVKKNTVTEINVLMGSSTDWTEHRKVSMRLKIGR